MLRRRHFSLIHGFLFSFSFRINYAEKRKKKQAHVRLVRKIKITAWTSFHSLTSEKHHILKNKLKRLSCSSLCNWLCCCEKATSLYGVFAGSLGFLPLIEGSDLNELHQLNKTQIRYAFHIAVDTLFWKHKKEEVPLVLWGILKSISVKGQNIYKKNCTCDKGYAAIFFKMEKA